MQCYSHKETEFSAEQNNTHKPYSFLHTKTFSDFSIIIKVKY